MFPLPWEGEVVIGRGEKAGLRVNDATVSRAHAKITMVAGQPRVSCLGGRNGTLVNGHKVQSYALNPADVISLGACTLVFHSTAPAVARRRILDANQFRSRFEEEVERSFRYQRNLSIVLFAFGANPAPRADLLVSLGTALRRADTVGTGTSGELMVLMPETHLESAEVGARRLLDALLAISSETRAGYASLPKDGYDPNTLLASAREALQKAEPGKICGAVEGQRPEPSANIRS
jgi:pSer/pThr/pTyr-binding forkhead associated (FHA) protein